jgi:hypothetical protein
MKLTPRMAKEINSIVQEEVQGALEGRRLAERITRKVDQKPVKLNKLQLRSLLREAIQGRQPGEPEPFQMTEKFGAYDVENRYDMGEEEPMMPHNFEATHKELFSQALDPVVGEFVEGLMEMYDAGFAPEGREGARKACEAAGQEMKAELMSVIEKWLEEGIDRIV